MLSFKIYLKVLDQVLKHDYYRMNDLYVFVGYQQLQQTSNKILKVKPIPKMHMIFVIIYHRANLSVPSVLYWIISPVYSRICRLHAVTQLYEA